MTQQGQEVLSPGEAEAETLPSAPVEMTFPSSVGNRKRESLAIEVLRALEPGDLQALGASVVAAPQRLLQIRHQHHALARLICEGRPIEEISLISGYSPNYINSIQSDPAFAELMAYYATQREQVFIDALERLKSLGLSTYEEIQRRLDEAPEKFTNREITELLELTMVKPEAIKSMAKGGGPAGAGVDIKVSFVGAIPKQLDITPR